MRRFAFLVATFACLAACAESPVEPQSREPSSISAIQAGTTLPPVSRSASRNGNGILIGSGTSASFDTDTTRLPPAPPLRDNGIGMGSGT